MNKNFVFVDLLQSKKFVTALIGVVTAVGVRVGFPEMKIEEMISIISPILVYIGAQGFADIGKGKALVETDEEPVVVVTVGDQELELDSTAIMALFQRHPELIKEILS